MTTPLPTRHTIALGFLLLATGLSACGASAQASPKSAGSELALAPFQERLLELSFDTASALPRMPHAKTRARLQEELVEACLELGQPQRALRYVEGIENWRRGTALADVAFQLARSGDAEGAQRCLEKATALAERPLDEDEQEWRRDRIRMKIARAHFVLGDEERASRLEAGVVASESALTSAVKIEVAAPEDVDARVAELDATLATGDLEQSKAVLAAYAELFERFYDDAEHREQVEERIRRGGEKLPPDVRIAPMQSVARVALEHGDRESARAWLEEAVGIVDAARLTAEFRLPLVARLAAQRHQAGDTERARQDLDAAFGAFEAEKDTILDQFRGEVLRPIAEAYQAMGDASSARMVYRLAVKEGARNENARPRAEDLAATCRSMAVCAVEPDAPLWAELETVRKGLRDPW